MNRGKVLLSLLSVAVVAGAAAGATPSAYSQTLHANIVTCQTDSPSYRAREYLRLLRSDTTSELAVELDSLGLARVPIDSIDYVRDEAKCAAAVSALNARISNPDTTKRHHSVELLSWGGTKYLVHLGGLDRWAVFDSTMTFITIWRAM